MMKVPDVADDWRTSSFSAQETDCVQMRRTLDALRDSKNPNGPVLAVGAGPLLAAVKDGQFDR
jgi:hypothetical protein